MEGCCVIYTYFYEREYLKQVKAAKVQYEINNVYTYLWLAVIVCKSFK